MLKQAILRFPDHPCYCNFRDTTFLTEYKGMEYDSYQYKLIKQLSGIPTRVGTTYYFHRDNLGFYGPEGAIRAFGSPENVARYNAVLRPTQLLAHFHRDSHAI